MEPQRGIEPRSSQYESDVLPLNQRGMETAVRLERTVTLLQSAAFPLGYAVMVHAVGIEPTSY